MFGILDSSVSGWQEMSQLVTTMQGTEGTQTLPQQTEDTIIQGFMLADKTPLVKIATPQTSPDRTLCSGYYANSQRLARVNTAAYQAVTNTTKMRAKDPALPQVHVDLSGHKPTIPLLANVESDLVYLQHWQPFVLGASVWEMIGAYRAKQIERGGTPPELPSPCQPRSDREYPASSTCARDREVPAVLPGLSQAHIPLPTADLSVRQARKEPCGPRQAGMQDV
jgi:hypothetical protein